MKLLPILFLAAVVIISGCTQKSVVPGNGVFTGKDCGEANLGEPYGPYECMSKELADCSNAKLLIDIQDSGDQYLLESFEKDNWCHIRLTIEKAETQKLAGLEGKSVTCTQENLKDFVDGGKNKGIDAFYHIDDIRVGIVASSIAGVGKCEGSLKEALNI